LGEAEIDVQVVVEARRVHGHGVGRQRCLVVQRAPVGYLCQEGGGGVQGSEFGVVVEERF
jgi:hypothetical protein